ncbi:type I restriction enzyme, R subunit [Arthrobacter alpinus]|uniref:Type I restriction enzyme, R subunit n=1 Tax=Arthrobacter alpinus TaxID=656366 RepID=A0A1H5LS79_9MICC|nr:DEAD/DEAH box helicase family protein [Arthrobacter alpinus]SEE79048.1 type I restriction enzyme, R subunit [Arthrobacter alpinus]
MAQHNEIEFERELCEYLAANGWLYSENDDLYDVERALIPEDVFAWLQETQQVAFDRFVKLGSPDEAKLRRLLLDRLAASLDKQMTDREGALRTLRKGFNVAGMGAGSAKFDMMQARPETALNPATHIRYDANRLRVMRQVHYGDGNKSIDLVFFLNGVPVATAEVKTENTQTVENAKAQYKARSLGEKGRKPYALLGNGTRALVHFALSEDEVWMTTKLDRLKTRFLPFNRGTEDGGAGNALNPHGQRTAYFWEQVLQRDAWLAILSRFIWISESRTKDQTGRQKRSYTLIFPRFHQWDVVEKLERAVTAPDPDRRFLIQHSAGSGKTNSIAWTAHRLARLQVDNQKLFDSVIVVTDRNVLDAQLQEAIRQIDTDNQSIVATIDDKTIRDSGTGSKSGALAQALESGKLIVVVTIQTFPFILDQLQSADAFAGKKFAVLADEAHSSQSGQTAARLKSVLTAEQQEELAETGEVEVDAEQMMIDRLLAGDMKARASHEGISFFAFTATPKKKTLELFGHSDGDEAEPKPFHLYSMKQAIEEEFILDVLRGYRTYKMYFDLAERIEGALDTEVDESKAKKAVMQWVRVNPTTIAQKAAIIVEHFRENVAHLLDGSAKAMVVSPSRLGAVRYKREIDRYIKAQGLDYGTLVAFSGTVEDGSTSAELGLENLTEATMNGAARDLRQAFKSDQYRIMIVANKFQTGFDQPLLSAMYVDKKLSGITAVQTLSRLNRTHTTTVGTKKTAMTTQVVDFVNDPADIQEAFEPYYNVARIDESTDPNLIWDILSRLDAADIYEAEEIEQVAHAFLLEGTGKGSKVNGKIAAGLGPAKKRYRERLKHARLRGDRIELNELELFRKNVTSFLSFYDFITQVVDYEDLDLAKKAIYLRLLASNLHDVEVSASIDLSDVELTRLQLVEEQPVDIDISAGGTVTGASAVASAEARDPNMVALLEVVRELSALIGESEQTTSGAVATIMSKLGEDETLVKQARTNSESQFEESPDLHAGTDDAVLAAGDVLSRFSEVIFAGNEASERARHLIARAFYRTQNSDLSVVNEVASSAGHRRLVE